MFIRTHSSGGGGMTGLGDIISDTDPCTLNPSDPVCQAYGGVQNDPCSINPNASYCQAAIVNANLTPAQAQQVLTANAISIDPTSGQPISTGAIVPSPLATSVFSNLKAWEVIALVLVFAGGLFGVSYYMKHKM